MIKAFCGLCKVARVGAWTALIVAVFGKHAIRNFKKWKPELIKALADKGEVVEEDEEDDNNTDHDATDEEEARD